MQWFLYGLLISIFLILLIHKYQTQTQTLYYSPYMSTYRRMRAHRKYLSIYKRAVQVDPDVFQDSARILLEHILYFQREIDNSHPFDFHQANDLNMMTVACRMVDENQINAPKMLECLNHNPPFSTTDINSFPRLLKIALCNRLFQVLQAIIHDSYEKSFALRLAKRISQHHTSFVLLEKHHLSPTGLSEIITFLHHNDHHEHSTALEEWLSARDITSDEIIHLATQRKIQLADEIRRAAAGFDVLANLDWSKHSEDIDCLHPQLSNDPSGIYPRMAQKSRLELRLLIEKISHHFKQPPEKLIQCAMHLSQTAEPHDLEQYIGYWFQNANGLTRLHRELRIHHGSIYVFFSLNYQTIRYIALWISGCIAGFIFLHAHHPVFMLPFFLIVAGCYIRHLLSNKLPVLSSLNTTLDQEDIRILVVLPQILRNAHEAIQAVRQMKILQHTIRSNNADFMLIGDFDDNITSVSCTDAEIIHTASSAVASLNGLNHFIYFQRARTWNSKRHIYSGRRGYHSAIKTVCALIAQGEQLERLVYATIDPTSLERRYAFIYVVSPHSTPAPGMLDALLQRILHPLALPYPTVQGWRGYGILSADDHTLFDGTGLIQPTAYLEATDALLGDCTHDAAIAGELAGYRRIIPHTASPKYTPLSWDRFYRQAKDYWHMFKWQFPYVQFSSGLSTNPLAFFSRFHLRECLRKFLIPFAQLVLICWSILFDSWLLLLFTVFVPDRNSSASTNKTPLTFIISLSSMPMRAVVSIWPLFDRFHQPVEPSSWKTIELWTQWIASAIVISLGLSLHHLFLPSLILGILFACYPWLRISATDSFQSAETLTEEQLSLIEDLAKKTWSYFTHQVSPETSYLPPVSVQYDPDTGTSDDTSPEAAGVYLLCCISAKELGLLDASQAAEQIRKTLESVEKLPRPYGLPCCRYNMTTLHATDSSSDTLCTGFLVAALMVTAQALRTWLPEMPSLYHNLSADAEQLIASFDLAALYNTESKLFYRGLDQQGTPFGLIDCHTDAAFILSVVCCARNLIPPEHFSSLRQSAIHWHGHALYLSLFGNASSYLLPGLFLPSCEQTEAYIHAMKHHERQGVWGQDTCGFFNFTPDLEYKRTRFGIAEAALAPCSNRPVYTPYAAALCLPDHPRWAASALLHYKLHGLLGPYGMCDAIDFSHGGVLISMYDSFHQGLILVAAAHVLADQPIRRYFCQLPEVTACLALLDRQPAVILPDIPLYHNNTSDMPAQDIIANHQVYPNQAELLGSSDFHLLCNAHGCSIIYDQGIPLSQWSPYASANGVQFYIADEGSWYTLSDAALPGKTVFRPGEVCIERICGTLKTELCCTVDTIRHRALHVLTITNLTDQERIIEAADFLIPDLNVAENTLEAARPARKHLTLHARGTDKMLHHYFSASHSDITTHVCNDKNAFIGRDGTLKKPSLLSKPAKDIMLPSPSPCLSFRLTFCISKHGEIKIWFITSMVDTPVPTLTDLAGIRRLSCMQHQAIAQAAPLSSEQHRAASLLVILLQENNRRITVQFQDRASFSLLLDLLHIASRFKLQGYPFTIDVRCNSNMIPQILETVQGGIAKETLIFSQPSAVPSQLQINGNSSLLEQLTALHSSYDEQSLHCPAAARLPDMKLDFAGSYGGFHPETGTYVIQAESGQTTPSSWLNSHFHAYYREKVDESGIHAPFEERVIIQMADGTAFMPWTTSLPRTIQMDAGLTSWETWTDSLDVKLTVTSLPGHRCGLRVIRIRNATDKPLVLHLHVEAEFSRHPLLLEYAPGVVMTKYPLGRMYAYLAGSSWHAQHPAHPHDQGTQSLYVQHQALLNCEMTLSPHTSQEAIWISGWARHADDIGNALHALKITGASSFIRQNRMQWAGRLGRLSISTPDDALDQLINRILPIQAISSDDPERILVLTYLAPYEAKRLLLRTSRKLQSREDYCRLACLLSTYVRITGDETILDVHIPPYSASLFDLCSIELCSLPISPQGLPLGEHAAKTALLISIALQSLCTLRPRSDLKDFSRKLLNAVDIYQWHEFYYGEPLRLDIQHLACTAFGSTPRTRQAVITAFTAFYDRLHGLIRTMDATDSPPLPGLPENGGMITKDAVCILRALIKTNRFAEAHELLQALNPIHHTDDPLRTSLFREAPFRLHGGMYAAPMQAGQAVAEGGDSAAAYLYVIVLEDILGLHRRGNVIHFDPHVPNDWDDFIITFQEGASTWHIIVERNISKLTIDGVESSDSYFTITDDGQVHHVHVPMT